MLYALRVIGLVILASFVIMQLLLVADIVINSHKGRQTFIEKWCAFDAKNLSTEMCTMCSLIYFMPAIAIAASVFGYK